MVAVKIGLTSMSNRRIAWSPCWWRSARKIPRLPSSSGCGATIPLTASQRTPAATGSAKMRTDSRGNTKLALKVDYLPRPTELAPALTTFVVWSIADDGGRVRNMGQLKIDNDRQGSGRSGHPTQNVPAGSHRGGDRHRREAERIRDPRRNGSTRLTGVPAIVGRLEIVDDVLDDGDGLANLRRQGRAEPASVAHAHRRVRP